MEDAIKVKYIILNIIKCIKYYIDFYSNPINVQLHPKA